MIQKIIYETKEENEALDKIVFDFYGSLAPLQSVLDANRHLAKKGPYLPYKTKIELPVSEIKTNSQPAKQYLWE